MKTEQVDRGRRNILKNLAMGTGFLAMTGTGVWLGAGRSHAGSIRVDITRCTGCRTCEAVCSAASQGRDPRSGVGNPYHSRIKIYSFNPDVDIPSVCSLCPDSPCITACPGRDGIGAGAFFKDPDLGVIRHNPDQCTGCGACVDACRREKTGVLGLDPDTGVPSGACTLCNGEPQCVANCPYNALSLDVPGKNPLSGMAPEQIRRIVTPTLYPDLS